ncbi:hypothetical protein [Acanthopleuribacter pedis]|uniref:Oxidoreductase n=1 Tax=Acanthopleuribacter pedis TaxID=442870 RepID=A0A8J7QKL0_9BACT|nr:hypothetical protein [Acanthopleuribacter pedis]MBO1321665.1 hypothetical protein [Acanthopleuribacter pedis]
MAERTPQDPATGDVLLLGASGLVGGYCLSALAARPEVRRIYVPLREGSQVDGPKVHAIPFDFDDPDCYRDLPAVEAVFCCLGLPLDRLKDRDALYRVDYAYPIAVARRYKDAVSLFSVVTSVGISRWSPLYYCRIKARLEAELVALRFPALHLFQPSLLLGLRTGIHPWQQWFQAALGPRRGWFFGPLSRFRPVAAETLAQAMVAHWPAAAQGTSRLYAPQIERLASAAAPES